MKTPRLISLVVTLVALFALNGCTTLMEGNSTSYTKTTNDRGETVYRQMQPAPSYYRPPEPTPMPYLQPLVVTPAASRPLPETGIDLPTRPTNLKGYLEVAAGEGGAHFGGHVGYDFGAIEPRIGISAFASGDFYMGVDLSARTHLDVGVLRPFAGIGGYIGDTKNCSREYDPTTMRSEEVCDKKFLSAGYVEAGAELKQFSVFVRNYNITRAGLGVPTKLFLGAGIRF